VAQPSAPFRAETLIEHHDFVLGLARSLVRDVETASDVAQETWLSALTEPPRAASRSSLRSWLARVTRSRAADRARDEQRRAQRERAAARRELDDSAAELRERVALAQEVVQAVLSLPDPARAVILSHYYEGLSAAEIARRHSVAAGTVRAQISRALDLLREHLDARHGGKRDAWSLALAAIAARGSKRVLGTKIAIAGAAAAAVVLPIALWAFAPRDRAASLDAGALVAMAAAPSVAPAAESTTPLTEPRPAKVSREPAIPAPRALSEPSASSIEAAALDQKSSAASPVVNGDFEFAAGEDGSIPGWTIAVGATNGALEPVATVKLDTKEKHKGRASLYFNGDNTTRAWKSARQDFPVRPGGTYHLKVWAKAEKVHAETVRGTSIHQFENCWVGLFMLDATGELVAKNVVPPGLPTSSWQKLDIDLVAPDTVRSAYVSVSLTMTGSLWVDDLELSIDGGKDLPPRQTLAKENFEKSTKVPAGWEEEVGAHNGTGSSRNTIAVDKSTGAGGSHASLHFSGNQGTIQWYMLGRSFDASAGDAFTFRAMVKAKDVRKEGIQFPNLHINLSFRDADDKPVGTTRFGQPGDGTFDWKEISVHNVAPEGAVKARAGIFLSMSGDAWFDDLEITKQPGSAPAYADWRSHETKHLLLRYSKDNPRSPEIKAYGEKLDQAFEHIVQELGVEYPDRITVYIYRDAQQGKNLTGRELDFSSPEDKVVHQRANSTLGHEMTHCVALKLGYAQSGILGEGIAVYLNGDTPEDHHKRAAQLLAEGELPAMKDLLADFRNQKNAYPAAGSFCGYLIETFGMEKFKRLYPLSNPAEQAASLLGKTFEGVDRDWREFLKTRG
jgi:RNA polymerase sigma-70 factor (ECF subfamily)